MIIILYDKKDKFEQINWRWIFQNEEHQSPLCLTHAANIVVGSVQNCVNSITNTLFVCYLSNPRESWYTYSMLIRVPCGATLNDNVLPMGDMNLWYPGGGSGITLQKTHATMMTSSNGNIFRVTGHLCGEFTVPRWIPHTKASDAELWCFRWSASE